ncbi:unnamed protein product [Euphydryas editha]|uniref:HTH psq-type domain-containing protein n=1 Tax=Euphydryas editha TaxID=104508 RepID=A0AAU9TU09_EUPED|nr:unnamed protein product [Euphydryas editha]
MVRHYKRKTNDSYSQESLQKAVEMVKAKEMTTYKASAIFGVPRSTILARVKGKRGAKYEHCGSPTTRHLLKKI